VTDLNADWKIYRTRFLVKAKQLAQPLTFLDVLGREHVGKPGDYLVESSDGMRRIAPREIFEDVYVPMGVAPPNWGPVRRELPLTERISPLTPPGRASA